ncbi:MAG: hypothetical protein ACO3LT_09770, partial [Ilumatobacteraceae bacterium]
NNCAWFDSQTKQNRNPNQIKTMKISDIASRLNLRVSESEDENGAFLAITSEDGANGVDYYADDNESVARWDDAVFVEWADGNSLLANEPERRADVIELVQRWEELR